MAEIKTQYVTSDNKIFTSRLKANHHQKQIDMIDQIKKELEKRCDIVLHKHDIDWDEVIKFLISVSKNQKK